MVLIQLPMHLGSFGMDLWADISERRIDDKAEVGSIVLALADQG